jgi:predicted Rossmann fold nucleotide-binding protein DprA/Smf involved in DNA uptake
MTTANRDVREVIREEPVMRCQILAALHDGPLTVPEIASAIDAPTDEVVLWVMAMRRYGWLAEVKGSDANGYFQYQPTGRTA